MPTAARQIKGPLNLATCPPLADQSGPSDRGAKLALAHAQHLGRTSADHAKRRTAVSWNAPQTVGALNTLSHVFGQAHAEACGGSGKEVWRCWWHIIVGSKDEYAR